MPISTFSGLHNYNYIADEEKIANPTLDYFADIDTSWFLNTKTLFQPYIEAGVTDIFYPGDTHWGEAGCEIVANKLVEMISNDD